MWTELKLWAKNQADAPELPTITECIAQVERVAKKLTGNPNALRPDVVAFYAAEIGDMIQRCQASPQINRDDPDSETQTELA